MSEKKSGRISAKRRDVLKLVTLGSIAGATALATGSFTPADAANGKPKAKGYRETEHVRKYYKTARF